MDSNKIKIALNNHPDHITLALGCDILENLCQCENSVKKLIPRKTSARNLIKGLSKLPGFH